MKGRSSTSLSVPQGRRVLASTGDDDEAEIQQVPARFEVVEAVVVLPENHLHEK